jgi:hypothetical protein
MGCRRRAGPLRRIFSTVPFGAVQTPCRSKRHGGDFSPPVPHARAPGHLPFSVVIADALYLHCFHCFFVWSAHRAQGPHDASIDARNNSRCQTALAPRRCRSDHTRLRVSSRAITPFRVTCQGSACHPEKPAEMTRLMRRSGSSQACALQR